MRRCGSAFRGWCASATSSAAVAYRASIPTVRRSEILFAAGLHPACKPRELAVKTRNHLARQTLLIARRAYETGGITNAPERVAALKACGLSQRRYRFAVFARAGEPCSACGTPIERIEVGSRRLYLCSTCQPTHQRGDEGDRGNQ